MVDQASETPQIDTDEPATAPVVQDTEQEDGGKRDKEICQDPLVRQSYYVGNIVSAVGLQAKGREEVPQVIVKQQATGSNLPAGHKPVGNVTPPREEPDDEDTQTGFENDINNCAVSKSQRLE